MVLEEKRNKKNVTKAFGSSDGKVIPILLTKIVEFHVKYIKIYI